MKVALRLVAWVFLGPLAVAGWGRKAEKKQYEACVAEPDGIRHRRGVHRVELKRTMADLSIAFEALGRCQGDGDIGYIGPEVQDASTMMVEFDSTMDDLLSKRHSGYAFMRDAFLKQQAEAKKAETRIAKSQHMDERRELPGTSSANPLIRRGKGHEESIKKCQAEFGKSQTDLETTNGELNAARERQLALEEKLGELLGGSITDSRARQELTKRNDQLRTQYLQLLAALREVKGKYRAVQVSLLVCTTEGGLNTVERAKLEEHLQACDRQVTINGYERLMDRRECQTEALSQCKESSKALEFDLNNCRNNLDNALDTLNDVPTQFTDQANQCSEKLGRVQQELKDALQANADAQDFHGQASSCNANLDTAKKALDTCGKDLWSTKQALEDARHDRDVCKVDLKAQDDCIDFTAHISHLCPRRG
ncbi:hypothetical protein Tdes44962_MAKER03303 [Teratosphaeria destructans]|uniref:Uncharacterized protein n=1 Tax=Teratosphaeria destructans TaxID=418781 RepID=A0A9W7SQB0_9PEZI|nr:hypothetical protein Tdes44962_MAKER03303 [Teratosphaeria destructans]